LLDLQNITPFDEPISICLGNFDASTSAISKSLKKLFSIAGRKLQS
jgi:hypothetical protein